MTTGGTRTDYLKVLYLPKCPPSITYRAWAGGDADFSVLRWYVERLIKKHGADSLLIACHDETDRTQAEAVSSDLGVFVTLCDGATPLAAIGEVATAFPALPLAYFQLESVFAPSDLLERVLAHHRQHMNDFTFVSDLPPLLTPEVVDPALVSALAHVDYRGTVPSVRDAIERLQNLRLSLCVKPFKAGNFYRLPELGSVSTMLSRDDAMRACQVLGGLGHKYEFEAIERWPTTSFEPTGFGFKIRSPAPGHTKVLYISPGSDYSGAEECLRGLIAGLARPGFQQTAVLGAEGVLAERLREAGCDVISANWDFGAKQGPDVNRRFAAEVFERVRPDVVHCNGHPGDAFLREAQARGAPVIEHVRGVTMPDGTPAVLDIGDHTYVAVSEFVKKRLIASGATSSQIKVVYDGVDADLFSPALFDKREMRRRFELPQDAVVVLMIARPVPQKRHDLMLDAFAELATSLPTAKLVLVGDFGEPAYLGLLRRKIKDLRLVDRVKWLPFQNDIRQIECASDIVVLPSHGEALGTCILESMALAKAVVVSDSGGTHELIQNNVNGLIFPGGDTSHLAATLQLLADNTALRDRIGMEAHRIVIDSFTLRHHAEQMGRVFQSGLRRSASD